LYDIITGGSTPIGLCEGEVKGPGNTITARKYCLNIPEARTTVKQTTTRK